MKVEGLSLLEIARIFVENNTKLLPNSGKSSIQDGI